MVKTDYFPIKIRNKFSVLLLDIVVEVLVQKGKKQKGSRLDRRSKMVFIHRRHKCLPRKPPKMYKILLDLISEFNKFEIQGQRTNTNCVSIH